MNNGSRATYVRRGLAILCTLIISAIIGNIVPTLSTAPDPLPSSLPVLLIVGGVLLVIMYFGGNWLRDKSNFFHKWFDITTMYMSFYLGTMLLLALFCGFMTGALLFESFGSILARF